MGKEIISLHLGQCGVQMGNAIWELLAYEHDLDTEGHSKSTEETRPFEQTECFFYQVKDKYVPRALMIDLEPTVIDELRTGSYRQFWNPSALISGKEDAANNYARGYLTTGKAKMEIIAEEISKMMERADSLAAFEIVHAYAGGTGSGLTALIAEHLSDTCGKKFRYTTSIYPSPVYSQSTVDPYNSSLFTHASIETIDCNVVLDNKALYDQCAKHLCEDKPKLSMINRLVASLLSSLFLSHRFLYQGSQRADCTELLTNLIPYPRIHFPMVFYSPLYSRDTIDHEQMTIKQVTKAVFTQQAATMDVSIEGKAFLSCAMLYRGAECPKSVYEALHLVKGSTAQTVNQFVDWCPATFKIGLNSWPPVSIPHEAIAQAPLSVCMIAGNVAVADAFAVNGERFDKMFEKRCFIHWYVGEGLEEAEFAESREEIQTIVDDYNALTVDNNEEEEETAEEEKNNENSHPRSAQRVYRSNPKVADRNSVLNSNQSNQEFNIHRRQNNATSYEKRSMSTTRGELKSRGYVSQSGRESIDFTPYPNQFKMSNQNSYATTKTGTLPSKPIKREGFSKRAMSPCFMQNDPIAMSKGISSVKNDVSLSVDSEYTRNQQSMYHGIPNIIERNFNKPDYSRSDISSVATCPLVVFEDDDSLGREDISSMCLSLQNLQNTRQCPTPVRRRTSVLNICVDGNTADEKYQARNDMNCTLTQMFLNAQPNNTSNEHRKSYLRTEHARCNNQDNDEIYFYPQIANSRQRNQEERSNSFDQDEEEYMSVTQVV